MSNKYKNVRGSMFDSKLEEACYQIIAEIIPPNRIVKNYPIVLTASVSWRVDFALLNAQNSPVFFIELRAIPRTPLGLNCACFRTFTLTSYCCFVLHQSIMLRNARRCTSMSHHCCG